ncbi:hypothetical protein SDC9_131474 [bioreactor metagenome]|uniref:Uncharacterized protein n=1 Tax=bioreactor metagenome TaxID=1076179 RepID=A0A645D614_9ZZZZ
MDDHALLHAGKARGDTHLITYQWFSKKGHYNSQGTCHQKSQVGNAAKEGPGRALPLPCEHLSEDGNKGHGQRAAGDKSKEQIGHVVGHIEGIEFSRKTELTGNEHLAQDGQ